MIDSEEIEYEFKELNFDGKYQYFPHLRHGEFDALVSSIAQYGLRHPIEVDEDGEVLDGHHRLVACTILDITPDYVVREFEDEEEKISYVKKANLARRHLTTEEKRQLIADELRRKPESSNNSIAKMLGVSDRTVGNVRTSLGLNSQKRVGADGKTYDYSKPVPQPQLFEPPAPDATAVEEIDIDSFSFAHNCPRCGFEFND